MFDRREQLLDEWLVLRSQEGDPRSFEMLVGRWQERLWRHAYRLTGSPHLAWDAVQDTWVSITEGIRRLKDPARFRPWAYTIVTRRSADIVRKRPPDRPMESDEPDELVAEPTPPSTADPRVARLTDALRLLPRQARALLSLRFEEGFEVSQIAEILGIPEGTVKSRLHHARHRLREEMERMERCENSKSS